MVVQWSPQAQVLTHQVVSCFVTHCGWKSTMEALSSGVPPGDAEHRVIGREEVVEYLREATSGVKAAEMKKNAMKWKEAAAVAVTEGGTSDCNIQEFLDEVRLIARKSS
ncbi:putative cinnamate beta-D-glucosyltransferase [Helianthus anomalus]